MPIMTLPLVHTRIESERSRRGSEELELHRGGGRRDAVLNEVLREVRTPLGKTQHSGICNM